MKPWMPAGLHLLPGVIDDQVHFRDPGLTHKEDLHTGSLACAKGGVTTFLEMPNTKPATITREKLHEKLALAAGKCRGELRLLHRRHAATTSQELQAAERTPGIKIFIGSSTGDLLVDEQEALERIFAETTLPICAHCEDETTVRANAKALDGGKTASPTIRKIRDHAAAVIATRRAMDLASRHQHRFHVLHVSTADRSGTAQRPSQRLITAEACPHHLFFNVDDYARLGSRVQMNPSHQNPRDNHALWQALRENMIQVVATDHAPHTLEEKYQPYPQSPSGLPAVENSLALMLDAAHRGLCTLEQIVRLDVRCPRPGLGLRRQRPHRRGLRCRLGVGGSQSAGDHPRCRANHQMPLESLGWCDAHRLADQDLGSTAIWCLMRANSTNPIAAKKPGSITPAAAFGRQPKRASQPANSWGNGAGRKTGKRIDVSQCSCNRQFCGETPKSYITKPVREPQVGFALRAITSASWSRLTSCLSSANNTSAFARLALRP